MSVTKFVKNEELKKLIADKSINNNAARAILKSKGIIPVCLKADDLASYVSYHFLGSNVMSRFQEAMNVEQNNLKSTFVTLKPTQVSNEDFLTEIGEDFAYLGRKKVSDFTLKNLYKNKDDVRLQFEYDKVLKGRVGLTEKKKAILDVSITPLDNGEFKVNIKNQGSSDPKKFIDLLNSMVQKEGDNSNFTIKRVTQQSLQSANKIEFYDKLIKYQYTDWSMVDVVDVSVNKENQDSSEVNEDSADEVSGLLSGIKSAAIKGDGLRNNDFVKKCLDEGFIFSSMTFKFSHKSLPILIALDINFKHNDLKINIVKTYSEENSRIEICPLSIDDQKTYVDYFQNVAYEVYLELIQEQRKVMRQD